MNQKKWLDSLPFKEDRLVVSQIFDKIKTYQKTKRSVVTYFLDERQKEIITRILTKERIPFSLYYFEEFCERCVLNFGEGPFFGITCFKIKNMGDLRHQDVLGALFGLGLKKEVIGDIFVEKDFAYFMVLETVKWAVLDQLTKIGRTSVHLEEISHFELKEDHFVKQEITTSSLRLDAVLSKLLNLSRSKIETLFLKKQVLLNYIEPCKVHTVLKTADVLSIRGYGKYRIESTMNAKSGKIKAILVKYQ